MIWLRIPSGIGAVGFFLVRAKIDISTMPRVLRIINRFNLGGPTYNASYLTRYLGPEYETLLIGGEIGEGEASSLHIPDSLGIKYQILPEMRRELNVSDDKKAYSTLKSIIKDFKPDVVHTHASKAGALGRRAAHKCGVNAIVHTFHGHVFHGYFGRFKTQAYIQVERNLARKSSAIVAISQKQKIELVEKFKICSEEKIKVIPLGFDLERFNSGKKAKRTEFRTRFGLENDEFVVGIVGRLVPIKNHELFLESVKMALDLGLRLKAVIVGDGERRNLLEDVVDRLNIRESVVFTGWYLNVDEVLAGLDLVALTSRNEGTPVSLIEAQAAGVPVISTNVGGVEDIVRPQYGVVASQQEFANEFVQVVKNRCSNMNLNGHFEWTINHFGVDRLVRDTRNLYDSLLT